jgi:hypothetical protein
MGWAEYKSYNDKLTEISTIYNELIYLCNNFDIKRINLLLINIIENYDFYIKGDQYNYSIVDKTEKLSNEIIKSSDYIKMLDYINENFYKIDVKYNDFILKIESLHHQYIDDVNNINLTVINNFKSEYKEVLSKLEELYKIFLEIPDNSNQKIDEKDGKEEGEGNSSMNNIIRITVFPVSNKLIDYNRYYYLRLFCFKNLHIILSDNYEVSDEYNFKKEIKKIYLNVYNKCIKSLINGKAKTFDEKFKEGLSNKIKEYNDEKEKAEEKAKLEIAQNAENKANEEKTQENEDTKNEEERKKRKEKREKENKEYLEKINKEYKDLLAASEEAQEEYDKALSELKKTEEKQEKENSLTVSGSYFGKKDEDKEEDGKVEKDGKDKEIKLTNNELNEISRHKKDVRRRAELAYEYEFGEKFIDNPIYKKIRDEFEDSSSTRTLIYLTREELDFFNKYIDVFDGINTTYQNKTIIEIPELNDETKASSNEIDSFKRIDRFLTKLYDDRPKNMEGKENPDKNIIVLPKDDEEIYTKYRTYFEKNYTDLIKGTNLIFKDST